jgi:hypothetical protein
MTNKKETLNNMSAVVAVTLLTTGAVCGTASAITGNDAGLLANSGIILAGEIVRNKKE